MRTGRLLALLLLLLVPGSPLALGCSRKSAPTAEATAEPPAVSDKTEGLLLTWIDEKGEFHAEQRVADVPASGRDMVRVRVLDPATDVASADRVFVADLRVAKEDGSYQVRSILRAEFEDVAVKRREKSGTAVLSAKAAASGAIGAVNGVGAGAGNGAGGDNPGGGGNGAAVAGRPAVIIYGASWCGPCHQAAAHLKKRGVVFVERDIEQDSSAAREMQSKLAKAGMRGGSIPVIDVRGRMLLGFDANAVDRALAQ